MLDFLLDMWEDAPKIFIGVCLLLIAGLVGLLIYVKVQEEKQWDVYKREHNCKIISHQKGDVMITTAVVPTANNGVGVAVGTTTSADKTGWLCDDGVIYYR